MRRLPFSTRRHRAEALAPRRLAPRLLAPQLLALATILALGLTACAGDGQRAGSDAETAPGRRFLSIGTAPPGGAFFVIGGAFAQVLQDAHDSWQVTAEATKGTQENIRRLARGELDFGLANAAITYFAVRGERDWGTPQEVRSVMTLAPNVAFFVTPADSDIESIRDLAGHRVVVGPAGAGFEHFVEPILEAHGVSYDDFEPLNATQLGAVDLLADGSAAAAFLGGAVPTASITQAASAQAVRFVPFDPEVRDELVERYPFFEPATVPGGTYPGVEEDFPCLNVGSIHLITSTGADDELVYQVTRAIWENRAAVTEKHPAGKFIRPEIVVRDVGTGFHPGAVRFYREIGIWPAETGGAE
jgi:TRAP transporter TAXI family solute receptor